VISEDRRSAEEIWRSSAEKWEANCKEADAEIEGLRAELDRAWRAALGQDGAVTYGSAARTAAFEEAAKMDIPRPEPTFGSENWNAAITAYRTVLRTRAKEVRE